MAAVQHSKSLPDPTKTLRVIGAGYPRTGTVSFSVALSILLDGPVCHSGTNSLGREEANIKSWISVLNANSSTEKPLIRYTLNRLLTGYVAVTDCPAVLFSKETADLFPNAIVIVTERDEEKWFKSFEDVAKTVWVMVFLRWVFVVLPTMRYFGAWVEGLKRRHEYLYNNGEKYMMKADHLERHAAYLKSVIPAERLHYYNVKHGWELLCKILDLPIPDVPFPHENDKFAMCRNL